MANSTNPPDSNIQQNSANPKLRLKTSGHHQVHLREAADLQYFEAREIRLSFSKEEWEQLDLMLSLLNKNRSASKQFPDLQAFVKWKLGRALKDQANERLFGGYEHPQMAELGKTLQIMGVE